jgi:hypothetical protein
MPSGTQWTRDELGPYYDDMILRENGFRITQKLQNLAKRAADVAQAEAPWRDITGAARRGLNAELYREGNSVILRLSHSVEYGKWLETIQDGKYATIMPTLNAIGPELIKAAGDGFTPRR